MDIGTKRNHEVTNLFGNPVMLCTFKVDRDGSCRRLCSKGGCITRNLIFHQSKRILLGNRPCHDKLHKKIAKVHNNDNNEYLPKNREDGKGLSGTSHIHKGSQNIQRK